MVLVIAARADLEGERQHGDHLATRQHMGYFLFFGTPKTRMKQKIATAQR
ncbi:MAG TPA: hypothetical protein VLM91_27775 [Candidatus Methylomirabilis sp.]|nr:hypothetical protein [Candidatus Methylomirabilis sp.]